MTATLQQVIDSLRHELQQYGEMLALLEAQHEMVARPEPTSVLISIAAIESQSAAIETARRDRETVQRQLAWACGRPDNENLQGLLPLLPDHYRPLINALIQEINHLLQRVHERATQNHSQLQRSLELMERFIATISSQAQSALLAGEKDSSGAESPPPLSAIA